MRGGTAALEREAANAARVQAGRVDRRELVRDEDRAARDLRRQRTVPARQVRADLPRDVGQVGLALAHGGGVGGGEPPAQLARDLGQRPLGVHALLADAFDDGPEERLVLGDQAMGLEDGAELLAHVALGLAGVPGEILGGLPRRPAQSALLPLEFLRVDRPPERRQAAEADDDRPANGYARRNGEALQHGALNA